MSPSVRAPLNPLDPVALAVRACGAGFFGVAVLAGAAALAGAVRAPAWPWAAAGIGAAAAAGGCAVALQCRSATVPGTDPSAGTRHLVGMFGAFGLLVGGAVAGLVVLAAAGTEFEARAAFGLSYAGAATAIQTLGAVVIARALRARARATQHQGTAAAEDGGSR